MPKMRDRLALVLAVSLLAPAAAGGAPPPDAGDAWRWVRFTTVSGLPSDFVVAALEVPGDGLWAITRFSLAHFNGFVWHRVPAPPEATGLVTGWAADGRGGIVAVMGGRLVVGTSAGLRVVRVGEDGEEPTFRSCAPIGNGRVLLADNQAVYQWDGRTCRRHDASRGLGRVYLLRAAQPQGAWITTAQGLYAWEGTHWSRRLGHAGTVLEIRGVGEFHDGSALAYVSSPASDRGLWEWSRTPGSPPTRHPMMTQVETVAGVGSETIIVHDTGEVMVRAGGTWTPLARSGVPISDARAAGFFAGQDLWIATDHGLYLQRRSSTLWTLQATRGPDDRNTVNEVVRSPDGRLFLATGRGLVEGREGEPLDMARQSPRAVSDVLTALAIDSRGRLWAGSGFAFRGVRWRDDSGGWHQAQLDPSLDGAFIHRIVPDRSGHLWFLALSSEPGPPWTDAAVEGPGAFRLDEAGHVERWGTAEGLPSGRVYAFGEGVDGSYWFGTGGGLSRWQNGQWRYWRVADGLRSSRVFTLLADRAGAVWFGDQEYGLGLLEGNRIRYLTTADGLATNAIWTVRDDDRGRIWAGGEGGVAVLENHAWTAFGVDTGLPNTRIWPVVPAGDRVYLGTRGAGLAILDLGGPAPPAPLVLPDATGVDNAGARVRWQAYAWWGELTPEAVLTRSRLDHAAWSPWSTNRDVRYTDLAPGPHVVDVQAKSLRGAVGPDPRAVAFVVPPPLFQRPVFYGPVGALGAIVLGLAFVLAVRQRRHHLALHRSEQRFLRTFQASPVAASIARLADGRFEEVNEAFVELSGYSREEVLGRDAAEIGLVEDTGYRARLVAALGAGRRLRNVPFVVRQKSGAALDALAYFDAIDIEGHQSVLGQYLDLTEQRRLEEQLRHAQKMESVGRLAGGVAHDFNNLLTVIIGNAEMLGGDLPEGDPRRDELDQIRVAAERAERLTRQLLVFARKQVAEPRVINVNELVLRTSLMLRRLIGEDVELVTLLAPDVEPVLIDPNHLEQVLVNLAVNARDAMQMGGTLTIRTSNVVLDERGARRQLDARPGVYVELCVTDTGTGMDPATLSRLFEPFFTTKAPGKGTGLGLATCYGVVKQAGGHISVESEQARGSTFRVYLPRVEGPRSPADLDEASLSARGGTETILVVEDEAQVRKLAAAVLRQRGYDVLEAGAGHEALQVAARHHGRLDVLVTDIVMPLMRGTELARRMRALRPEIKVLYMSGYTDDAQFREETATDHAVFLAKPFAPSTLTQKVRDLLDDR
jgi:PAS domain S-box-containing protein